MTTERKTMKPATRAVAMTAVVGALTAATAITPAFAEPTAMAPLLAPYYTELDLTGDGQVTQDDLTVAATALGITGADPEWASVGTLDADGDAVLTVADLAGLAQRMLYDDGEFELVEASVIDMQSAMNAGVTTSVEITQQYIDRIAAYDRTKVGARALNSIIAVNDEALAAAAQADATRAAEGMTSMLLGVPIALKDNYNTADMPTTAGCGCWADNQTATDAFMVAGLRDEGAVILAKASLDEFAYGFASEFSTGQEPGRSLLVASPYDTSRTAGGSSGGTGAAIAANLSAIGFGTDTGGSIRVPSSYNQLVGIRPTVGLASRDGIVPLALSQDTGGPMARSVIDAAVALDAVVGVDGADAVTARQEGLVPASYTASLSDTALQGARIGVISSMQGSGATLTAFNAALATLEAEGATIVPVTAPAGFSAVLAEGSGSTNEFKRDLQGYIDTHLAPEVTARSIDGILATGNYVTSRRNVFTQRNAVTDTQYEAWAGPTGTHTVQLAAGKTLLHTLMDELDLDALIYPTSSAYGTIGNNLRLSPNTGMPAVTVPMGTTGNGEAGSKIGVNLELLGRDFSEGALLGLAYDFEQATKHRTTPALFGPLG